MMIQRAIGILKDKGNWALYHEVKEEIGMPEPSCRKLFKSSEFGRFVIVNMIIMQSQREDLHLE